MTTETTTPVTFKLTGTELRDLVSAVMRIASKDTSLPMLNSVLIASTEDGQLTATATDRYRVGMKRITPSEPAPAGIRFLLGLRDLARILTIFKASRQMDPNLELTLTEQTLTVEATSLIDIDAARLSWHTLDAHQFPKPISKILGDCVAAQPAMIEPLTFNPVLFADFAHAVGPVNEPIRVWSSGPTKPIGIAVGNAFIGAIMPTRNYGSGTTWDLGAWGPLLGIEQPSSETPAADAA